MFDFVRRHKRIMQFLLVLLIFPSFVLFGIEGYQRYSEGNAAVARVAGRDITQADWDAAHRQQADRLRQQMPGIDARLLDSPEFKRQTLEQLLRERVLFAAVLDQHLSPTDDQLARFYQTEPDYAWLLQADKAQRRDLLAARGLTEAMLDAQVRQDLALRQVLMGVSGSAMAPQAAASAALDAYFQQREVQWISFAGRDYLGKVQASDAEVQAFYEAPAQAGRFMAPEAASVDYLVLDLAAVRRGITVAEDDLRRYYEENAARYTQPEERRVRHILIAVPAGASAEAKAQARARAQGLIEQLGQARARFAELARQASGDPESASRGGDLDWAGRGAMVSKRFEEAVFALKKGELAAAPVETEFGFHVVELLDQRGGERRSFESVRAELETEVGQQLAQKRFAEVAEQFTNLVEQEDSLKPVAQQLGLELRHVDGLGRSGSGEEGSVLRQPKLLELLFQPENLAGKRNTEVVELAANQLVAAHVVKHTPARRLPLAEVREQARAAVLQVKAAQAARDEGQARLKAWQASPPDAAILPAARLVSRAQAQSLPPALLDGILRAAPQPLPRWTGIDLGDEGYALVRLNRILPADAAALGDAQQARSQYAQAWSRAEAEAYYQALRKRYKAQITAPAAPAGAASEAAR
ncbi:MAG: SurA N-terminal domain-containing protein [Burkholderiaceae bacterium]|nr:SurA N-terminal domain-containing protein [Burkholderiaceae bacterium]